MKKGRFLWSAHRITEKQKAGKARNIKEKQLKNSRSTASKLPAVRLSSASANRQLSQPKIFPSPGAAWPRGFFCGRRGGRGAWPPAALRRFAACLYGKPVMAFSICATPFGGFCSMAMAEAAAGPAAPAGLFFVYKKTGPGFPGPVSCRPGNRACLRGSY